MSATPRTDAAVELARPLGADPMPPAREYVHADFARELERENAALRLGLEGAQMSLDNWIATCASQAVKLGELDRELVALREDKARLDWLERSHYLVDFINEDIEPTSNGEFICTNGDSSHTAQTLRAAIDAARKEAQP